MPVWIVIVIVLAAAVLASAVTAAAVRRHDRKKLEYMLDAFEDGEYNFRFASRSRFNRTLNRIKLIMDRQRQHGEQESWTKLIRVLTHEIMNTVSPIASLSDMLGRYAGSGEPGHEAQIKAGLETISSSSKDLMKFVESYRELAGVARPLRRGLLVGELVHKVIELTAEQFKACGAACTYSATEDDLLIYADESQISRILINLIKNALEAGAETVEISACPDSAGRVVIRVANDGEPISKESAGQIFIPFFTTKDGGSGIGLSLSRQIMRAHNGTLELSRSDRGRTEFTLVF